jgi:hypothetical protein
VAAAAVLGEHLRLDGVRLPVVAVALLGGAVAVIGLARGR